MTQEAVQVTTTPPLPGLQLVQTINGALETLGTDFAGSVDPAAIAWAYSCWADTGTGTLKRRNAANSAWVIEGRLLRAHLPMYAQGDVPSTDIGPIYIIGKGPAEWKTSAYDPLIKGIPGMTFAQIDALTEDQGPIICTDQDGILYAWDVGQSEYVPQTADNETALAKSSTTNLLTPSGLGFSLQPHIEGSAAFTHIDNQIVLTGIVPTLALEVGDVIEITGSANNNRLHTVESITDDDTIIVNYEHRNGAGSLSLIDETANVTIKRITKWFAAPIGLGQAWVDVLASRSKSTAYQNTTGRTISVSRYNTTGGDVTAFQTSADGLNWVNTASASGTASAGFSTPTNVGPGHYYRSTYAAFQWAELR